MKQRFASTAEDMSNDVGIVKLKLMHCQCSWVALGIVTGHSVLEHRPELANITSDMLRTKKIIIDAVCV